MRTKEYSPEELKAFQEEREKSPQVETNTDEILPASRFLKSSIIWLVIGVILAFLVYFYTLEAELYILGFGLIIFGIVQVITGSLIKSGKDKNPN